MTDQRLGKILARLSITLSFVIASGSGISRADTDGGLDFATTLLSRTYSPGLSLNPTVGFGHLIWGETTTPWHGFIRPHLDGVFSPTIIEGKVGIEIFPVSILGFNFTRALSRRFSDTKGQDCLAVQCQGELDYTDFTVQAYFGRAGYFSSLRWTRTFFDAVSDGMRPVYDVGTSVLIKPSGDSGDYTTIVFGKDLNPDISVGVLIQNADFHYSGQHQEGQYLIVRSDLKWIGRSDLGATVGLGRFKSDLNVSELSAILSVTYTHTPAIGFGR